MAPHFHHGGVFPGEASVKMINEFCEKLAGSGFAPLKPERTVKLLSPRKLRVRALYPLVHRIGKARELPIETYDGLCRRCGKCVTECPAGAVSTGCALKIDPELCLHCYHCVTACRFGAINSPVEKLDRMIDLNVRIVGTEKQADEIFI